MFHTEELKRLAPIGVFFAVYSLAFLLWKATFIYSLPFLLGLLIAAALQPVIRWTQGKLRLSRAAASGAVTALALALLLSALILLTFLGVRELADFLARAAGGAFSCDALTHILSKCPHITIVYLVSDMEAYMFHTEELKRLAPIGVFFAVYSLAFLLWKATFIYSLPFLLGLLIAAALQPVIRWTQGKLRLSRAAASGAVTALALALLLSALILLTFLGVRELADFLARAAGGGFPEFSPPVQRFFRWLGDLVRQVDAEFLERHREQLMEFLKNSADLAMAALNRVLGVLGSLPVLLAMALVTGFSAFFLARDFDRLRGWARGFLSDKAAGQLRRAAAHSSGAGKKYLLSYVLIYLISFCEAFVILSILNVPYPLISAVITCFADILPVLGPGFVLGPIAVWQALCGSYGRAAGVLVGWAVMGCVRQVIEPKLVASTAKLHPLTMLAAVYFSLAAGSLWVLVYTAGLFMLYSLLRNAGILPRLISPSSSP